MYICTLQNCTYKTIKKPEHFTWLLQIIHIFHTMILLNILKNAFETYRNSFLISLLGSIALVSIVFLLYVLIFPMLLKMPLNEFSQLAINKPEEMQKILLTPDFQIKMALFFLLINCIIAPMEAGFYKIFDALKNKEEVSHKILFSFYNSTFTGRILGFVLLFSALKWMIAFLLTRIGLSGFDFSFSMILSLLFTLTIPFIIFENQSIGTAMKQSSRHIAPHMFTALIVLFIGIVLSFLGVLLFGFGVVLTLPFFFAINYSLYKNVTLKK